MHTHQVFPYIGKRYGYEGLEKRIGYNARERRKKWQPKMESRLPRYAPP